MNTVVRAISCVSRRYVATAETMACPAHEVPDVSRHPLYNPQQALLVEEPPTGTGWVHELKLDGFRMGVLIADGAVQIISRRGTDYTTEYPEIVEAARGLPVSQALLDGEVVVLDDRGVASFQRLQQLGQSRRGLAYFAFDLLALDHEPLYALPLRERKARLEALIAEAASPRLRYSTHFDAAGPVVFQHACALGAEGIVSKRLDAPYRPGIRAADWQKIKCVKRQEFVVGGFTDPDGSRLGVGSMLIGYYEGRELRFAGKVGTGKGWTGDFSRELRHRLAAIEQDRCPFTPRPPGWLGKNAHWVTPQQVVEVQFAEWTEGGHARHPTLLGFRTDKAPTEVVRELAAEPPKPMLFPALRLTAAGVAAIYRDFADVVLPHVANRPLTLVRARQPLTRDDALRTQAEFVHHTAGDQAFVSDVVPRLQIQEKKKVGEYCYVDSTDALLALIESGVVEWHTWNARIDEIERPDRIVFDFDPGPGVAWPRVVEAARAVRRVLGERDLQSWVKTTGGKGLHVVVPFARREDWDTVYAFSKVIATDVAATDPAGYTLAFEKEGRDDKVLIDYKRNYRTAIAVAAFSIRARPHAPLSVPVAWSELARLGSGERWTLENIRARLARLKADPWADYWTTAQTLPLDLDP
jgi:bifunctional non-homologous end joining protein LigD